MRIYKSEVEWYRQNGRHANRIVKDRSHNLYVIGDISWNQNPENMCEIIEPIMCKSVNYEK